jgi:chaperonin GroES
MIKPLGDRIVLQIADQTEQTVGGIVIANNAKEKPITGEVIAVSDTSVGELEAPKSVKKGDSVIFDKYAGQEIELDGQEYLVVHEKDILGVL